MTPLTHGGLAMTAKTFLISALLITTALPFVPGASAWTCVPGQDRTASVVGIGVETFYNRLYASGSATIEEVWEETNGEAGLQISPGMSCLGKADRLVRSVCIGYCPIQF